MKTYTYTNKCIEGLTARQMANRLKRALIALNGNMRMFELEYFSDEIAAVRRGEGLRYNDGYFCIEVDESFLYVDYTGKAVREFADFEEATRLADEN